MAKKEQDEPGPTQSGNETEAEPGRVRIRAKDGFKSLSEDDLERLRASVRHGLGDEASRNAARELTRMAQEDGLGYE